MLITFQVKTSVPSSVRRPLSVNTERGLRGEVNPMLFIRIPYNVGRICKYDC